MKKVFFLLSLLLAVVTGTKAAEGDAPTGGGLNIGTILFIVGFIVFIIIVRKVYEKRNKAAQEEEAKNKVKKEDFNNPKYWYQCKKCRVTIRKTLPPNNADCFKAVDHQWTQMAEVGTVKYLCRSCSTLIEAKEQPVIENCPEADVHDWERLG